MHIPSAPRPNEQPLRTPEPPSPVRSFIIEPPQHPQVNQATYGCGDLAPPHDIAPAVHVARRINSLIAAVQHEAAATPEPRDEARSPTPADISTEPAASNGGPPEGPPPAEPPIPTPGEDPNERRGFLAMPCDPEQFTETPDKQVAQQVAGNMQAVTNAVQRLHHVFADVAADGTTSVQLQCQTATGKVFMEVQDTGNIILQNITYEGTKGAVSNYRQYRYTQINNETDGVCFARELESDEASARPTHQPADQLQPLVEYAIVGPQEAAHVASYIAEGVPQRIGYLELLTHLREYQNSTLAIEAMFMRESEPITDTILPSMEGPQASPISDQLNGAIEAFYSTKSLKVITDQVIGLGTLTVAASKYIPDRFDEAFQNLPVADPSTPYIWISAEGEATDAMNEIVDFVHTLHGDGKVTFIGTIGYTISGGQLYAEYKTATCLDGEPVAESEPVIFKCSPDHARKLRNFLAEPTYHHG